MSLAGSLLSKSIEGKDNFTRMVIISIAAHAVLLVFLTLSLPGSFSKPRISGPPSYTPVTLVGPGDLAAARSEVKTVQVKKATKAITAKQPTLIQKKTAIKELSTSTVKLEKKTLTPEKVAAAPEPVEKSRQQESTSQGQDQSEETSASREHDQQTPSRETAASSQQFGADRGPGSGGGGGDLPPEMAVYISIVIDRIMQSWFLPPAIQQQATKQNLMAVIAIRVDRSGKVTLQGVEEKSGNSLFDNYALAALKKVQAESLPPLPEVFRPSYLDLGVRFHPSEVGI